MFGLFKKVYLVEVSFGKNERCKSIRARYDMHRGDKISNSFVQLTCTCKTPDKLYDDIMDYMKETYPNSINHKIEKVIRL